MITLSPPLQAQADLLRLFRLLCRLEPLAQPLQMLIDPGGPPFEVEPVLDTIRSLLDRSRGQFSWQERSQVSEFLLETKSDRFTLCSKEPTLASLRHHLDHVSEHITGLQYAVEGLLSDLEEALGEEE